MSQSDYLKQKTISIELKNQSKLAPILNSQFYTRRYQINYLYLVEKIKMSKKRNEMSSIFLM